jgi:ABC-type sulfate transport system substrate-binding protein
MKTMENSIKTMEQNPETSGKIDEHCKWEILATKAAKTKEGNLDEKKNTKNYKNIANWIPHP